MGKPTGKIDGEAIPDLRDEIFAVFGHSLNAAGPIAGHACIDFFINCRLDAGFESLDIGFVDIFIAEICFRRRTAKQRARHAVSCAELGLTRCLRMTNAGNLLSRLIGKELDDYLERRLRNYEVITPPIPKKPEIVTLEDDDKKKKHHKKDR